MNDTPRSSARRSTRIEPSPFAKAMRRNVVIAGVMRFAYGVAIGLGWMWETLILPVTRPIRHAALWGFKKYMIAFDRLTILDSGYRSRPRAGMVVTATLALAYLAVPLLIFLGDGILFLTTYGDEKVYLTGSQEIDQSTNLHNVKGCETEDCTPENALYYRVVDNNMNSVWAWLTHGHPFYPDTVAASAGNGFSKCTVTSYGVRWKFITRNFEWYPYMLQAHCRSVVLPGAKDHRE